MVEMCYISMALDGLKWDIDSSLLGALLASIRDKALGISSIIVQ